MARKGKAWAPLLAAVLLAGVLLLSLQPAAAQEAAAAAPPASNDEAAAGAAGSAPLDAAPDADAAAHAAAGDRLHPSGCDCFAALVVQAAAAYGAESQGRKRR